MFKSKKILAFIPARSGSKGLKDKNIKPLCGRELISYTICAALESGVFDRVVVSTDDENYAQISRRWGADVPFLRSPETSSDSASTLSALLETLEKIGQSYDAVAILQPTSPLRTARDIVNAAELFVTKDADSVVSVFKFPHSLAWVGKLGEDLSMSGFIKEEYLNKRRQDIEDHYMLNGAIYFLRAGTISADMNYFGKKSYAYVMSEFSSIDIDGEEDFKLAQLRLSSAD